MGTWNTFLGHRTLSQGQVGALEARPQHVSQGRSTWPLYAGWGSKLGHMMVQLAAAPVRDRPSGTRGRAAYGACLRPWASPRRNRFLRHYMAQLGAPPSPSETVCSVSETHAGDSAPLSPASPGDNVLRLLNAFYVSWTGEQVVEALNSHHNLTMTAP